MANYWDILFEHQTWGIINYHISLTYIDHFSGFHLLLLLYGLICILDVGRVQDAKGVLRSPKHQNVLIRELFKPWYHANMR